MVDKNNKKRFSSKNHSNDKDIKNTEPTDKNIEVEEKKGNTAYNLIIGISIFLIIAIVPVSLFIAKNRSAQLIDSATKSSPVNSESKSTNNSEPSTVDKFVNSSQGKTPANLSPLTLWNNKLSTKLSPLTTKLASQPYVPNSKMNTYCKEVSKVISDMKSVATPAPDKVVNQFFTEWSNSLDNYITSCLKNYPVDATKQNLDTENLYKESSDKFTKFFKSWLEAVKAGK